MATSNDDFLNCDVKSSLNYSALSGFFCDRSALRHESHWGLFYFYHIFNSDNNQYQRYFDDKDRIKNTLAIPLINSQRIRDDSSLTANCVFLLHGNGNKTLN